MSTAAIQAVTCVLVADENDWNITKHRSIRIDPDSWTELGEAAAALGYDRSRLIKQFVRWYLRKPGAELPPRPSVQSDTD